MIHLDISPTPPLNFTGGQKNPKFGLYFRYQSPLTHCGFETEELITNLILSSLSTMIELRSIRPRHNRHTERQTDKRRTKYNLFDEGNYTFIATV